MPNYLCRIHSRIEKKSHLYDISLTPASYCSRQNINAQISSVVIQLYRSHRGCIHTRIFRDLCSIGQGLPRNVAPSFGSVAFTLHFNQPDQTASPTSCSFNNCLFRGSIAQNDMLVNCLKPTPTHTHQVQRMTMLFCNLCGSSYINRLYEGQRLCIILAWGPEFLTWQFAVFSFG